MRSGFKGQFYNKGKRAAALMAGARLLAGT